MANDVNRTEQLLAEVLEELRAIRGLLEAGRRRNVERVMQSPVDYREVVSAYNEMLGDRLGFVTYLTDKRRRMIAALARRGFDTIERFRELFRQTLESPFLLGNNKYSWKATFEWLMRYDNAIRVLEGVYHKPHPLPPHIEQMIDVLRLFKLGKRVELAPSVQTAEVLSLIYSALLANGMASHPATKTLQLFVEQVMPEWKAVALQRRAIEDNTLAGAIALKCRGIK